MGIGEMYRMGGGWTWVITLFAIITLVLIILQFIKLRTADLSRIVWPFLIINPLMGVLGTLVGLTQAGMAIAEMPLNEMPAPILKALAIATTTTEMALMYSIPLAIAFAIANHKRHKLVNS